MTTPKPANATASLSLPRILCLHGGGVNAKVFEMQSRSIVNSLRYAFRLVFVDGPYITPPHPDIVQVYGEFGPFYSWVRMQKDGTTANDDHSTDDIFTHLLLPAMDADPGFGEWVGVMGFSQGAKIAASILCAQETAARQQYQPLTTFNFGIIMAGRGPIIQLDPRALSTPYICEIVLTAGQEDMPGEDVTEGDHTISIPTVHVHGLEDPGLDLHRIFLERYFRPGTTRLVEWDGGHRLPIKTKDVSAVIDALIGAAKDGGAI